MVKVKSIEDSKSNYGGSGGRASTRYSAEIKTVTNWQSEATSESAEDLYAQKVQEAIAAKRRQKALAGVSNAEWQNRALTKGAASIGIAITQSADKQSKAWTPYRSALEGVILPDKTTDPLTNLTERAGAIVTALVAKRKEIKG